jgi:aryl-alcohol dehydrogenase-like predicted oxidoreductase
MEYRQLGQTDIKLSVIAFGTWAIGGLMWGGTDRKDAIKAILASYELGVTSIDSAPVYGKGLSEEIVAEALENIPRDKVQILTKFGLLWSQGKGELLFRTNDQDGEPVEIYRYAGKESIIRECEDSLRRLRTDYIDLYQIHSPDKFTPIEESMEAVASLLQQGKIRAAGVCNYTVEQMRTAEKVISLASNQVPYNMVRRGIENNVVPYCIEYGKSIIAFSPLQRGLLTGKIKQDHVFKSGDTRKEDPFYTAGNILLINRFLDRLRPLAEGKNASLTQLVIRWTIDQPGVTAALVGARSGSQARENALASQLELTIDDLAFISQEFENARSAKAAG